MSIHPSLLTVFLCLSLLFACTYENDNHAGQLACTTINLTNFYQSKVSDADQVTTKMFYTDQMNKAVTERLTSYEYFPEEIKYTSASHDATGDLFREVSITKHAMKNEKIYFINDSVRSDFIIQGNEIYNCGDKNQMIRKQSVILPHRSDMELQYISKKITLDTVEFEDYRDIAIIVEGDLFCTTTHGKIEAEFKEVNLKGIGMTEYIEILDQDTLAHLTLDSLHLVENSSPLQASFTETDTE